MPRYLSRLFVLLALCFVVPSYAIDEIYLLPKDTKKVQKQIVHLFDKSTKSIDIAMYNFKYKTFIKALKRASKRDIKINLYLDSNKAKESKIDFIKYKTFDKKLHIKAALFDNKTIVFGSANWKKESFDENLEVVYITDDKKIVKKFKKIFQELKEKN